MAEELKPKGLSKSCTLLIVIAGMERFAFKGVASNMVTYLTDVVKMSNSASAKTVNTWGGFTSMLPLLVAPMADSHWDRCSTILASSFLYVAGLVGLTSTAMTGSWSSKNSAISSSFLFFSLFLISLGQGGYNPSLQAFGADQLDHNIDEESAYTREDQKSCKKTLFYQWWYFGVCSGSLLGVTLMAYIQDTFGWDLGFAIPSIAMILSVACFSCGARFYSRGSDLNLDKNPFWSMVQSVKARASCFLKNKITLSREDSDAVELELQEKPLNFSGSAKGSDLENQKTEVRLIKNTKVVLRLLPIWTMLLMFAVIFQQPPTFFTKQGMTMKRNIGTKFKIPPATLQSAITLSIMLLMPLYDKILIPIMRRITQEQKGITVMQRMGIGMFLSVIAMAIAAIVETKRLKISQTMTPSPSDPNEVPLSIFWLLPQYIVLGISDIFTVVGMLEFFNSEVPVRMRTMGSALYTSVFGVGSFISAIMISVIETYTRSKGHNWFSDNMSQARLNEYYWVLSCGSAVSLMLYVILCKFYKKRSDLEDDTL